MVVFVAAIFAISGHIVVGDEIVVIRNIIRGAVRINGVYISGIVLCLADLCEVSEHIVGSGARRHAEQNGQVAAYACVEIGYRSGGGVGSGIETEVRLSGHEFHAGGQVIGNGYVLRIYLSLVGDSDGETDRIAGADLRGLPNAQGLDQSQIEGLGGNDGSVVVVLVFALFSVAGDLVVVEQVIVVRIVVEEAVGILLRHAIYIFGTADLSQVL